MKSEMATLPFDKIEHLVSEGFLELVKDDRNTLRAMITAKGKEALAQRKQLLLTDQSEDKSE